MNENPISTYTGTAKILHWLMALLIFAMLGLGFYMSDCIHGISGQAYLHSYCL